MAADYAKLAENLRSFYDFGDKVVLVVGAGGGKLFDPTVKPKKLIAIDRDPEALKQLEAKVTAAGGQDGVEYVAADFETVQTPGDVVYFEFCLHEMPDPEQALVHARELATDVVVLDHASDSQWPFYAAEDEKVHRSSEALKHLATRRCAAFCSEQRFKDYAELLIKLTPQGPVATQRAERFAGSTNIVIPMDCILVQL
jgi:SAM-dependent methyltransferase